MEHSKILKKYQFSADRFDNEAYINNPLLKFKLNDIKRRQHNASMRRRAALMKIKCAQVDAKPIQFESGRQTDRTDYMQMIQEAVASAPVPNISTQTKQKIIRFVPDKLRQKYPNIVDEYMSEVSANYLETIKSCHLRRCLAPTDDTIPSRPPPFRFKRLGRTKNYSRFRYNRKCFAENFFLPYKFIRYILDVTKVQFPRVLNDFGQYASGEKKHTVWMTLSEFESVVQRDLEKNSIFLKEQWYPKIVRLLLVKYYKKRFLPAAAWPRVFACAKGLINREITELKVDTFKHIIEVLADRTRMPRIKFQAICSASGIELHPSLRDVLRAYRNIFKCIATVASRLPALEHQIDRTAFAIDNDFIKIEIGDIFMGQMLDNLYDAVEQAYVPIAEYIEELQQKAAFLYSSETKINFGIFLDEPRQIDEYLAKISEFHVFKTSLQKMVQNEYFGMAMINQSKAISGMRAVAQEFIEAVTLKIVDEHQKDCQRICDWFEAIKRRALEAPKSTETLLANGEFMLQVKNKKIAEIQEHIQSNLKVCTILVELTDFTPSHSSMLVSIVRWTKCIHEIFEQNASQFEIYKNQFEEHLGVVTRKLTQDIDDLVPKLAIIDDMYETERLRDYHATLDNYNEQLHCFEDYIQWINKEEKLFKLPVSQYPILEEMKNYVVPFAALVKLCIEWLRYYYIWMDGPFEYLDPVTIETSVARYMLEFETTQKYYRNRIKQDMLGNPVLKFRGQTEDPDPEKHPVPLRLCSRMLDWIKGFKVGVYIVKIMCNSALRDRHWVEMSEIAGFDLMPDAGTSLRKITKFGIDHLLPSFEIISIGANKELQLQNDLYEMLDAWRDIQFPLTAYKDTDIRILANIEDIQVMLDDHTIKTLTMRGSAFVKPCEDEVRAWYDKLIRVNRTFDEWLKVQRNWLYLLPILSSDDIRIQMPDEGSLFDKVNRIYCKYIGMAIEQPIVMEMATTDGLLEALIRANQMLDDIKIGVNNYLEKKRLYFPRFFFLSNDEMLKILSETKHPQNVQPNLGKCFEGIHRLQMDDDSEGDGGQRILAMLSLGGEKLNFERTVSITAARGCVEKWLRDVETEMQAAVQHEVTNSYADFVTTPRTDWMLNWPQMVVLTIAQIFWTSDLHSCLAHDNREMLHNIQNELMADLDDLIELIRSPDISALNRMTLKSLCILEVHTRDIVQRLLANESAGVEDFEWLAHMRYYWIDGKISVQLLHSTQMSFGNEYLGNFQRIVMTPLTERCFRTIVCALENHSFAWLHGPTGTGKSETVKDMARALAIQCKVFNSLSDLNHTSIAKFLKGIVASGAWMCFEDFNRIDQHTLSVIGQYVRSIVLALRGSATKIHFNGVELPLHRDCFLCIFSNPDYVARTEIPDNLKVLFRPIAMMKPELTIIAQVTLYSGGFENSHALATKVATVFKICAELLPPEDFYDFGLRNMKIVLRSCFTQKYGNLSVSDETLVCRSLTAVIQPILRSSDVPIFNGLIDDLFPSNQGEKSRNVRLRQAFVELCLSEKLQPIERLYGKLVEAYETIATRHALMLIGNPFTGKSTILRLLAKALRTLTESSDMEIEYINAKSVTSLQLFGAYDSKSMDWTDGLVSNVFRKFFELQRPKCHKWVIFDGPIESEWIENLNTVLDDDRKMCLSSGEAITLTASTLVIFEVDSLSQASPATISRIGIIHMATDTLGWYTLAQSWIEKCNVQWAGDCKQIVLDLFSWIFPPMLKFAMNECKHTFPPLECTLVMTTFHIFQMVMDEAIETNADDYQKFLMSWIQAAAVFGVVWGIGGILHEQSRDAFDRFHRQVWACPEEYPPPSHIKNRLDMSLPSEGNMADYFYVFKQKGAWKSWADFVRRFEPDISHLGIQVATVDTARYSHLLELHVKYDKQMLLVGPTGTGKTSIIQNVLHNKLNANEYVLAPIKFTISTNSSETHEQLFTKLVKLKRNVYGPPEGQRCILFIDDFNLPAQQPYGSHTSAELLRQLFDYRFVYDLKSTRKIALQNILTIATCGVPGGSWHAISSRVLGHFNCLAINEFPAETMSRIFSAVLMTGLKRGGHATDVITNVNQIVAATLNVYYAIVTKMKPTPAKCHYAFNMRDMMRVCTGCALLRKESVENKKMFARIWFHETMRVFHDRLVDEWERDYVFIQLVEQIEETFKDTMDQLFESYVDAEGNVTRTNMNRLMFGCYVDRDGESGGSGADVNHRRYEELANFEKLVEIARTALEEYNATTTTNKLTLILFAYAIEHLNRICRIVSMPGGNGLIIGMGDSGRKSLVQLAAFICMQQLFQMRTLKNYDMHAWKDDVRAVLKSAGGLGVPTIFLLSENQLTDQLFLTDVDHLLNSADVPNLWPIDERQDLLGMVRLAAQGGNRNIDVSPAEVFSFFVNRCRQNLHIILCFSPIGNTLRSQLRLFPSLTNCCTIDWFDAWPDDALEMVASKHIVDVELPDELRAPILTTCRYFHASAHEANDRYCRETGSRTYVTSASYLELVRCFVNLFDEKKGEIMASKSKFMSGLDTLQKAAEAVEQMQYELNELQPKLHAMAANCNEMTVEIESKTLEASVASEQVKRDEVIANDQAAAAEAMEDECSKDLAQAVPVLEDALQALNTLKPADITLVKSMKNPPSAVKLVMAAVCVMKAVPPDRINDAASGKKIIDYWGPSKRILGDMGFLQSLKDYDKDDISPDIMKKIRKDFIPHKDFQPHVVAKASSAAEGLCKWIKAIENFESVNTVVLPKKMKLAKAKELLRETRKFLAEKRALAAELEAKVVGLNEELEKTNREKERTAVEVELCERKLERAETLINNLGEEKSRWTEAAATLQLQIDHLVGDILISSAFIAYLGPFTGIYRRNSISQWHEHCVEASIPCSAVFDLRTILGNEAEIQRFSSDGLPCDGYSIENVIIMRYSCRRCLFIDPQRQANKWIKRTEASNHLKVVKLTQDDYFCTLIDCQRTGTPILIEDIGDTLDPILDPILCRTNGNAETEFRLYLTCNRRHPNYSPETCNKVNIVNFMLVSFSLKEKLLDIVVAKENPYLREERDQLLANKTIDSAQLIKHEEDILSAIGESSGDILEDATAIQKMDDSKRRCREIIDKQRGYVESEAKITAYRESYKRVAEHSAIIYGCLNELPNIDPMYQFSLDWFINLYNYSIENASRSLDLDRRIVYLITSVTRNLYNSVCRSVFERDKLLFAWILTTKLMMANDRLDQEQLRFFIGCDTKAYGPLCENPDDTWLSDAIWANLNALAALPSFGDDFIECFRKNVVEWKAFAETNSTAIHHIPEPWQSRCSEFDKLLLLKQFHREQVAKAVVEFIAIEMGAEYVNAPHFDIRKSFEESNILTPLIFILAPGIDPMEILLQFAQRLGYAQSFKTIALGPQQQSQAEKLIEQAQVQGAWICLQNCHMSIDWLTQLELIWARMSIYNTTSSFRLWLTTASITEFPRDLLQNGIKLVYEQPKGFQNSLQHSYKSQPISSSSFYDGCAGKDKHFQRLIYSLCFFDAVLHERQHYGPVGWNVCYNFNECDLHLSLHQLQRYMNKSARTPYAMLKYLIGECNYGGHVTDDCDQRLLRTFLGDFVSASVVENPSHQFGPSEAFILPRRLEYREIVRYIDHDIPSEPTCELFGLHVNADFASRLNRSQKLLDSMAVAANMTRSPSLDDSEAELCLRLNEILIKLPEVIDLRSNRPQADTMGSVLSQEAKSYNALAELIRANCVHLMQAIQGSMVLTAELEAIAMSVLNNKAPDRWHSSNGEPIASFVTHFCACFEWVSMWWKSIEPPATYWLGAFLHTRAFLAAIKLIYARAQHVDVASITFDFCVMGKQDILATPSAGVFIDRLHLVAAHWNGAYIEEPLTHVFSETMPAIHLQPITIDRFTSNKRFECPLFQTSGRKGALNTSGLSANFIMHVWLPVNNDNPNWAKWIKRGVAVVCRTEE